MASGIAKAPQVQACRPRLIEFQELKYTTDYMRAELDDE